jgi:hypothetical protein
MANSALRRDVIALLDGLPEEAGWDELIELIELMRDVAVSRAEIAAGKGMSQEEIERHFGIQ